MECVLFKRVLVASAAVSCLCMAYAADWYAKDPKWGGHDPSIMRYDDGYALMTTNNHLLMQGSEDALNWTNYKQAMPSFPQWLKNVANGMEDIWFAVKNEKDMYDLIRRVSYSKVYDPLNCEFDVRSEYVATKDYLTTEVITDPSISEYVYEWLLEKREKYIKKSRQQLQDEGKEWESVFTEVVNCNDRTWQIRFFEDENKIVNMSFK